MDEQPRDDLAATFAVAWSKFLGSLPGEFRTAVAGDGVVLTIDNEDPVLPGVLSQAAETPVVVVPRTVEVLGMKELTQV